ncbi:TPA: type II secretion system F family protein [Yersinia enterocolitica]|uniref:type II secretion system F family protein n=1 Tax=Yersinia enterocolitica TaxID=630 RepID=UPI0005DBAE52|nr:type II secretion system F family protein [Yersinia enterocolitica]AOF13749.1 tight adherance operon protein [Yersinia enterocolitica]CFV24342.1 putative tight adherance operon protein [Yersinia enterocolitica]HDL8566694.1 type II secretion system F family protein [Yersinia enterocolitica]HEB0979452.1 type II secretion system F family protein [Yersinia enterocolitica]HEB1852107.1 type II secretion system F family protein [Yersinia enterocolitica]
MKILLFISISLFGLIVFFKSRNKNDNISIYNKINSVEIDKIKSKNNEKENEKTISNTINLPFILHNIIYLKLIIAVTILIITAILATFDLFSINLKNILVMVTIILIMTLYFPKVIVKNIVAKRTKSLLRSLPFFIDITAACVQSGMTIDNSLSYSAKKFELINADLSLIMLKVTRRAEINGLENAIKEFNQSSTELEIRMFCNALQYSISFGATVYEQLIKLSKDMREMQLLVTEEKISKLTAKLTIPLFLFILIPFIVLVISPSVLELIAYE